MAKQPDPTPTKPARAPDAFQKARQIYNARTRLFDKADQLLRDADHHTQSLVRAQEEADEQAVMGTPDTTPRERDPQARD